MIMPKLTGKGSVSDVETKKRLSLEQREELLRALKARFEKNMNRHKGLEWVKVQPKLEANTEKLWSLSEMERTGGKPDASYLKKQYSSICMTYRSYSRTRLSYLSSSRGIVKIY